MEREFFQILFQVIDHLADMALDLEERTSLGEIIDDAKRRVGEYLDLCDEYSGTSYWHHAESDCCFVAHGPHEARHAMNAGCTEVTRQWYLDFETGDLI
jgi:hypothetical protein